MRGERDLLVQQYAAVFTRAGSNQAHKYHTRDRSNHFAQHAILSPPCIRPVFAAHRTSTWETQCSASVASLVCKPRPAVTSVWLSNHDAARNGDQPRHRVSRNSIVSPEDGHRHNRRLHVCSGRSEPGFKILFLAPAGGTSYFKRMCRY